MILFGTLTMGRGRLKRGIKTRLYSNRVTASGPGAAPAGEKKFGGRRRDALIFIPPSVYRFYEGREDLTLLKCCAAFTCSCGWSA